MKQVKGPSATRTCSPISKMIDGFGLVDAFLHLVDDAARLGVA